jgi:hypothetical protein
MTRRNYFYPLLIAVLLASCAAPDTQHHIVISTRDQKLAVLDRGTLLATYPISTSKFGLGDSSRSSRTPLGQLEVAKKIGDNAPLGAVFKDRVRTGEIVAPNSPGRDPIVTRILWLRGREAQNANAFGRYIYIHGTPEERLIGCQRATAAFECAQWTWFSCTTSLESAQRSRSWRRRSSVRFPVWFQLTRWDLKTLRRL